jgi:polyphosphate kinase 2 (PPK2 family)
MLDDIVSGEELSKETYQARIAALEPVLFHLEWKAREAKIPVIILVDGLAAAGTNEAIQTLTERLDPRSLRVYAMRAPSAQEALYPWLHRFWLKLPNDGEMAIFDASWYSQILGERIRGDIGRKEFSARLLDISQLEEMLIDDDHVIIKLWFHIGRKEQEKRLRRAEKDKQDFWEVTDEEWSQNDDYKRWRRYAEEALSATNAERAPWTLLDATTPRLSRVRAFEAIIAAVQAKLEKTAPGTVGGPAPQAPTTSAALDKLEERADQVIKDERSPAP